MAAKFIYYGGQIIYAIYILIIFYSVNSPFALTPPSPFFSNTKINNKKYLQF